MKKFEVLLDSDANEGWREQVRERARDDIRSELAILGELPRQSVGDDSGETQCEAYNQETYRKTNEPMSLSDRAGVFCDKTLDAGAEPESETEPEAVSGKKSVKFNPLKQGSTLRTLVLSKQFSMAQTSILGSNTSNSLITGREPKTLLNQSIPKLHAFLSWKKTVESDKLMHAAIPMLSKAAELGYECKPFTLVLNEKLSKRLDAGDKGAIDYIRDQMCRQIKKELDPEAWFLYAIEKAPVLLSKPNSRRRWHLHGQIIGPVGFSEQRTGPIRDALSSLKGEAKTDLMFSQPMEGFQSVIRWAVYCAKNELSVLKDSVSAP